VVDRKYLGSRRFTSGPGKGAVAHGGCNDDEISIIAAGESDEPDCDFSVTEFAATLEEQPSFGGTYLIDRSQRRGLRTERRRLGKDPHCNNGCDSSMTHYNQSGEIEITSLTHR
jgi:hypothetical protein